jgi:hypothetical protein
MTHKSNRRYWQEVDDHMKKLLISTAIAGSLAGIPAVAGPTLWVGATWTFGGSQAGQLGLGARVLSDNQRDQWVAAAGATFYPGSGYFGYDFGVGYNYGTTPLTVTYDFNSQGLQFGVGWADLVSPPEEIVY